MLQTFAPTGSNRAHGISPPASALGDHKPNPLGQRQAWIAKWPRQIAEFQVRMRVDQSGQQCHGPQILNVFTSADRLGTYCNYPFILERDYTMLDRRPVDRKDTTGSQ
jgi:hypothetical protein